MISYLVAVSLMGPLLPSTMRALLLERVMLTQTPLRNLASATTTGQDHGLNQGIMGRELCRRIYHGSDPMYIGYYHNFADEELNLGVRHHRFKVPYFSELANIQG